MGGRAFQLAELGSKDLRQTPLLKRKQRLERLLENHRRILYLDHVERFGLALFQGRAAGTGRHCRQGWEESVCGRSSYDLALAEDQGQELSPAGQGRVSAIESKKIGKKC